MPRSTTYLRSVPVQARSRATFERILEAAAQMLEEEGWDGFNTNVLAERAQCRVSAVYRYFPNKEAIVATLAERAIAEWDSWFDHLYEGDQARADIEVAWCDSIDLFYESIHRQVGGLAIRRVMQMSPELQAMDRADGEYLVGRLADSLKRYCPEMTGGRAQLIAVVLMESVVPVMDAALQASPRVAKKLLDELKQMHVGYLRSCMTQ